MSKQTTISKDERQRQKHAHHDAIHASDRSEEAASEYSNQPTNLYAKNLLPSNPNGEFLTPEKLRSFIGCNHYNDEEALAVIESLNTLGRIIVGTVLKPGTPIDNQQVLHLDSNIKYTKKAA